MIDILFVCDALAACGFGHASRCAQIGRLIRKRESAVVIAFQGEFTADARELIMEILPDISIHDPGADIPARVALIDRMADPLDADAWDPDLFTRLKDRCSRIVHLASGMIAPRLPPGAFCVGYQPGGPAEEAPGILWGLRFAPVSVSEKDINGQAGEANRAFVAIGGAGNGTALRSVLEALSKEPRIRTVDLLLSPVGIGSESAINDANAMDLELIVHNGVDTVIPLLVRAGLVIASQGNLGYEAMALARPVVLIGLKQFQVDIAERLAKEGLAINGGPIGDDMPAFLGEAVARAIDESELLADNCRKAIDGRGLQRIAGILLPEIREAA